MPTVPSPFQEKKHRRKKKQKTTQINPGVDASEQPSILQRRPLQTRFHGGVPPTVQVSLSPETSPSPPRAIDTATAPSVLSAKGVCRTPTCSVQVEPRSNALGPGDPELLASLRKSLIERMTDGSVGTSILANLYGLDPRFRQCVKRLGGARGLADQFSDITLKSNWFCLKTSSAEPNHVSTAPSSEADADAMLAADLQCLLVDYFGLAERDFDPRHHFCYHQGQSFSNKRGQTPFLPPPPGSVKLALRVDLSAGNGWLDRERGWPVAYHGTNAQKHCIHGIVSQGLRVRGGCEEARVGERYGVGVYASPDPEVAATYCDEPLMCGSAAPGRLRGRSFHIIVQCRVRLGAYQLTRANRVSWRVPREEDVRACGLLLLPSRLIKCRHAQAWFACCGRNSGHLSGKEIAASGLSTEKFAQDLQHLFMKYFGLSDRAFDSRHHFVYSQGQDYSKTRGGEPFKPPPSGSTKLALCVNSYSNSDWLSRDSGWPVAYLGLDAKAQHVREVVCRSRTIKHAMPDPLFAAEHCGDPLICGSDAPPHLRGKLFHVLVQCRVRPGHFKSGRCYPSTWHITDDDNVRPCGLLLLSSEVVKFRQ